AVAPPPTPPLFPSTTLFRSRGGAVFDMCLGDAPERVSVAWSGRDLALSTPRGHCKVHWIDPFVADVAEAAAAERIVAPMPGTVTDRKSTRLNSSHQVISYAV